MTPEDRKFQATVLSKYRGEGTIPAMQKVSTETGISISTIATFMHGNSANETIRSYLRIRFEKNLKPIPEDILKLFAIWDKDAETED